MLTQECLHRFSVAEYYRLGEPGLLDRRTELIEGLIIDMEPIGPWHADIVDVLTQLFAEGARALFRVRVQSPIDLGPESQPQPDLVLCRPGRYRDRHPTVNDIYLVVEVADTRWISISQTSARCIQAPALPSTGSSTCRLRNSLAWSRTR
jgi:Uma2 family endonuclease